MQPTMPFRWIEEAEARTVVTTALCERAAQPPRWNRARQTMSRELRRLAAHFSPGGPSPRLGQMPPPCGRADAPRSGGRRPR